MILDEPEWLKLLAKILTHGNPERNNIFINPLSLRAELFIHFHSHTDNLPILIANDLALPHHLQCTTVHEQT